MKALILNSGMGTRMGDITASHPKCMTPVYGLETIVSRQLSMLADAGIEEAVMTTGYLSEALENYCRNLNLPVQVTFVKNPEYDATNYIYSIYCAREYLDDDILLMHGDIVIENEALHRLLDREESCMAVYGQAELPEKDFKAVLRDGCVKKVGIEYFEDAVFALPVYKLRRSDWKIWLDEIVRFCESGQRNCYAEKAFNEVSDKCCVRPVEMGEYLCAEVDNPEDLAAVSERLEEIENRTVYLCFSADLLHGGHMALLNRARRYGRLVIGVLSDEAVASYKRFPLIPYEERKALFSNISGVYRVVEQKTLSYRENILRYKPTYVAHGDDWVTSFQKPIRQEVIETLESYGGKLLEFPYSESGKYDEIERRARVELALPDMRRSRLRKAIAMKGLVTAMESHSGITGLIVENTVEHEDGKSYQFDAMWVSSLCDSTAKGKPDIELVDMTSRFKTIEEIMEVTTKPIIFDGDTGGLTEHFVYTVRSLERMGVSAVIIEDKTGLKKNSLFGTEVVQTQDEIGHFCEKIAAGKSAQRTRDFMIIARIESLILEQGMEDAMNRARAYVKAGADGIMIHSRRKEPDEIFEFCRLFRSEDAVTPLVVVPTSFNSVTEDEFKQRGVNVVIYANQLTRSGFPAMQETARAILRNHRAKEVDDRLMSIKDIITLIEEI